MSFLDKPLVNFHKHEDCQITSDQVESIKILDRMKERAKNESLSVNLIYENETLRLKESGKSVSEISRIMPPLDEIKCTLYRSRWTRYPHLPKHLSEIVFATGTNTERFMNTFDQTNERFLLVDCIENGQRIIIFASDLQLRLLCNSRQIGVDGTFKSCPGLFAQFYIIMGWCKGECMPVAFALLGGKMETTYRRMILELVNACRNMGLEFKPPRIIIDFEQGAFSAFKFFFKDSHILGCFFHFGQCLFRKLVELGLKKAYGEDEALQKWFNWCVSLVFIPLRHIETVFADKILDEAPFEKYPLLNDFTDYMLETWIENGALFPPDLLNQYSNLDEKSNNNNEGYNHRFNVRVGTASHPNIWKFLESTQKEEFLLVQVRCEGLKAGTLKSLGPKKRDLQRSLQISNAKIKYLASLKSYDDLIVLLEDCTCSVQNFLE